MCLTGTHVQFTTFPHLPVVSDQALTQPELPEDVHHDLHGGVVSDGEGAHVQDRAQF